MRALLLFVSFLCFVCPLSAQLYTFDLQWKKLVQPTGNKNTESSCVAEVPGQGFIWAGYKVDAGNATDIWIQRLDYAGNVLWETTFGGDWYDTAVRLRVHDDGSFIVLGLSGSTGISLQWHFSDAILLKYSAIGELQWWKRYGSPDPFDDDSPWDVRICEDGGYAVCGGIETLAPDGTSHSDAWIFKTDTQGKVLWERRYGGYWQDVATGIVQTEDQGFAVCVNSMSEDGDFDLNTFETDPWLLKLNEIGLLQWKWHYGGTQTELWYGLEKIPGGGFILSGEIEPGSDLVSTVYGGWDAWVCRVSGQGDLLWSKNFGGSSWDGVRSMSPGAGGWYWIGGFTLSNDHDICRNQGQDDFWAFAVDLDGHLAWSQTWGGSGYDHAFGIAGMQDGFLICGSANSKDGDVGPIEPYQSGWLLRIRQPETFNIAFPFSDTILCGAGSISLHLPLPDSIPVSWNHGFSGNTVEISDDGIYIAQANLYGCSSADTVQLSLVAAPRLPSDTLVCFADSVLLEPDMNVDQIYWSTGSDEPAIWVRDAGFYFADMVRGECLFQDTVLVEKTWCEEDAACVRFPNAFTPDGDGVNDLFSPIDICGIQPASSELSIYNRWGELLYRNKFAGWPSWDGRNLPSDVYVWRCWYVYDLDGLSITQERHGDVTLLR